MLRYPAILHQDGDVFWIEFVDFPEAMTHGAASHGDDPIRLAQSCLADAILFRMSSRESLPDPTPSKSEYVLVEPIFTEEQSDRLRNLLLPSAGSGYPTS